MKVADIPYNMKTNYNLRKALAISQKSQNEGELLINILKTEF